MAKISDLLTIDYSIFAFPSGLALGAAVVALLYVVERRWGRCKAVERARSPHAACLLLGLIAAYVVAGGLLPALADFSSSWPFVTLLSALEMHLALVIIHRLRSFHFRRDLAFILVHAGLWLALFSGMAGAADTRKTDIFVTVQPAGRSPRLLSFDIDRNPADGSPIQYSATVVMDGDTIGVAVNSPYSASIADDIYLVDFDTDMATGEVTYCVLQNVHQPWKYPLLAGIVMLLTGTLALTLRKRKEAER
ncbi:MAG: hypothetical protein SO402_01455 [Prevotella sp.]|uniref:hypothetical protein n=1 Tax=Prevotella sp. P5-92 TaxID=2024222 RepID=UPI000B978EB7|nr:hypothetical protein [Prevotella sp. P5-92]MDY4653020.1 hypothetical protein [Prevotella sp.]OYP58051.1 hypothetical protein CIK99_05370 [Prevotella sp. P5-92]